MNVKKNAINEVFSSFSTSSQDQNPDYRDSFYNENAEKVKQELNNIFWMYAPKYMTLEKGEAITGVMLDMIFHPQNYINENNTNNTDR